MKSIALLSSLVLLISGCSNSSQTEQFQFKDAPEKLIVAKSQTLNAGENLTLKVKLTKGVTYREVVQASSSSGNVTGTVFDPNLANPDSFSFSARATNAHTFVASQDGSYSLVFNLDKPSMSGSFSVRLLSEAISDVALGSLTNIKLAEPGARQQLHFFLKKGTTYRETINILSGSDTVMANLYDPTSPGANTSAGIDLAYFTPGATGVHTFVATQTGEYIQSFSYVNSANVGSMTVLIQKG